MPIENQKSKIENGTASSPRMRRSYVQVLVIWMIVLTALFLFQEYFA
jgi:hypothetical protein